MSEAQRQYEGAVGIADAALELYVDHATDTNFRRWRDASDIAIKWHRATRLEPDARADDEEDPLAEFDALARQRQVAEAASG